MHIQSIQSFLCENKLDAALISSPQELVMCCGHYPHWNGSLLVIFADKPAQLFIPDFEPQPSNIEVEVVRYQWATAVDNPWYVLFDSLMSLLPEQPRVVHCAEQIQSAPSSNAAEGGVMPTSFFKQFDQDLSLDKFSAHLVSLRGIKTAGQIEKIKLAHQVANDGIAEFYSVKAGMSDGEVAALIEYQIARQLGRDGINYVRAYASIQSGPDTRYACQFNRTGARILERGDFVFLELAVCVNGYWLDVTRTTVVGEPSDQQVGLFNAVRQAVLAAVTCVAPEKTLASVYQAAFESLSQQGFAHLFPHALGHGTGFAYHDPGLTINATNSALLQVGQVLTIEPGVYGEEILGGIRVEENIVVTATGYEFLSFPQTDLKGHLCREKSH